LPHSADAQINPAAPIAVPTIVADPATNPAKPKTRPTVALAQGDLPSK